MDRWDNALQEALRKAILCGSVVGCCALVLAADADGLADYATYCSADGVLVECNDTPSVEGNQC